jgi:hypothetical protein
METGRPDAARAISLVVRMGLCLLLRAMANGSRRRILPWIAAALACEAVPEGEVRSTGREPGPPSGMNVGSTQRDDEVAGGRATGAAVSAAPVFQAGRYVLSMGDVELEVDPAIGGRVIRFSLAGENILTGPEVVASGEGSLPNMYGSTFWTSPQSAWGWPPEIEIDAAAHRANVSGDVLTLTSAAGAATGYSVRKRFWTDAAKGHVSIEYTLENQRAALPAAPWEISRVPKEGIVLFAAAAPALVQSNLPSTFADGVAWVDIALAPAVDSKLFQDGSEGWIAYVYRDLAFIKTFADTPTDAAAPGEAEIEVFVNGLYDYVEIEQQGRYALPPAGGSASWQVDWILRRLPSGLDASLGSRELVAWVRELVAASR